MKRLFALIVVVLILSLPLIAMGEDSKEVLTLKRDLAQETVTRVQAQLTVMQYQMVDGQKYLQDKQKELNELNARLQAIEVKEKEPPKVKEEKK